MTNNITIQQPPKSLIHHTESHALYNGVVFVVWMFGLYLFLSGIAKIINPRN